MNFTNSKFNLAGNTAVWNEAQDSNSKVCKFSGIAKTIAVTPKFTAGVTGFHNSAADYVGAEISVYLAEQGLEKRGLLYFTWKTYLTLVENWLQNPPAGALSGEIEFYQKEKLICKRILGYSLILQQKCASRRDARYATLKAIENWWQETQQQPRFKKAHAQDFQNAIACGRSALEMLKKAQARTTGVRKEGIEACIFAEQRYITVLEQRLSAYKNQGFFPLNTGPKLHLKNVKEEDSDNFISILY